MIILEGVVVMCAEIPHHRRVIYYNTSGTMRLKWVYHLDLI